MIWNKLPWYIGRQRRIPAAKREDIESGLRYLHALLRQLGIVVLVEGAAQPVRGPLQQAIEGSIYQTPHPSNRVFNVWPEKRAETQHTLHVAAEQLGYQGEKPV